MIEILASLVVGALVVEWWQTYHGEPPAPPAVSAPPPPRPAPAVVLPAEVAPAPAPVEAVAAEVPQATRTKPAAAAKKKPATPGTAVEVAAAVATAAPVAADEPVISPSPLNDAELAARASTAEANGDYLQAAADRTELLRRHPQDSDARRALVFALQRAGLPERALAVAEVAPGLFTPAEFAALHGDVADQAIALAIRGEPRADRNRVLRERAVAALDRACKHAEANNLEAAQNRCTGQRVVYFSGIGLHRAAVDTYAPATNKVDDAAHTAAAKSLLELTATRRGAADEADDAWARRSQTAAAVNAFAIDRLFAREQLRDAGKAIDERIAQTPTHLKSADGSVVRPNWDRVVLESEKMRALAWRGKIREAIAGQQVLVAAAPADTDQRLQLADFYRQNGQRDLADAEMRKAAALDPDSRALLAARIDQAIDDGEFQDSRRDLKTLRATWPADDAIAALDRRHDLATTPRIEASVSSTRSDGPGTINASDELWQEVTFYGHAWERRGDTRLFVFEQGEVGEYANETSNPLRVGLGMMTRHRDWDARFSVHGRRGTPEDATGATLAGHVRFNDHWEADATLQSESTATPMLALENGIDAWSADVGLQYNVRAGHYYRLDAQELGLDDGNSLLGFALSGRQPLYADQPHQWALLERIETSASDELAVPYFSPDRMSAGEVQLEYRGVLLAGGTLRWEHIVTLGVGASEQTGFGSDTIGDVRWEHLWAPGDRLELGAGIEWRRRAYDGETEDQRELFASLLWRLP